MAREYHRGTFVSAYLSPQGAADLALMPGVTKRARLEHALAVAVTGSASTEISGAQVRAYIDAADADEQRKLMKRCARRLGLAEV